MQPISPLTAHAVLKSTMPATARQTVVSHQDTIRFGASNPNPASAPKSHKWLVGALLASGALAAATFAVKPLIPQAAPSPVVFTDQGIKLDLSNAHQVKKWIAQSAPGFLDKLVAAMNNTDDATQAKKNEEILKLKEELTMVSSNLDRIPDKAQRKALMEALLTFQRPEALALHKTLNELKIIGDELDGTVEEAEHSLEKAEAKLDKLEKEGKGSDAEAVELKTQIANAKEALAPVKEKLLENVDQTGPMDIGLDFLTSISGNAIKYGLTTFTDEPQYQAQWFKQMLDDPRAKIRKVAANYLDSLPDDATKAELIRFATNMDRVKAVEETDPDALHDMKLVASNLVSAASSIKDEGLRIAVLTELSHKPLSTVKSSVTNELAKVTGDYEKYEDMVIGASSSTIPAQFKYLREILTKWPQPIQKELSVKLSQRGMNPPNADMPDAYSRALAVALLKNLPASEDAYKMELLKKSALDLNPDPSFATTIVGYPFADAKMNRQLSDYYLGLTQQDGSNTYFPRSFAIASSDQLDYTKAEIEAIVQTGFKDPHETVRAAVVGNMTRLLGDNTELRNNLLNLAVKDPHQDVRIQVLSIVYGIEASPLRDSLLTTLVQDQSNENTEIRYYSLDVVYKLTDAPLQERLLTGLSEDKSDMVRFQLAQSLPSLKNTALRDTLLEKLSTDENLQVQLMAKEAQNRIKNGTTALPHPMP